MSLAYTALADIDRKIETATAYYRAKQKEFALQRDPAEADLSFRELQLKKLYYAVKDHENEILEALHRDFHRSRQESLSFELVKLLNDILHIIESLRKWARPRKLRDRAAPFMFGRIHVERIAMGSVLIVSPFNFPVSLALTPLAHALGAGNCVVLKPSEQTPACAAVLEKVLAAARFPAGLVQVVQGGVAETGRLLESCKFDLVFYTGSPAVGAIVAGQAAKSLTPCVLELGGKSPVFLTQAFARSHIKTALKRIFYSSFGNSGQICVAPDYMLVHASQYEEVVRQSRAVLQELWPEVNGDLEYTHMIHQRAYDRAAKKLERTKGTVFAAKTSEQEGKELPALCMPPALVFDVDWDDALMEEENFAPVLPILKYNDLDEALDMVLDRHDTPLVQYLFSDSKREIAHILARLRSGDCLIGDTLIHAGLTDAPFGGIGQSGYGSYGGEWGFAAFTHERTVFRQPFWMDMLLSMRYPPFSRRKARLVQLATERPPWFDRRGRNRYRWKQWLSLTLLFGAVASLFALF